MARATNLQATGSYYILGSEIHWTQISWSYVKATCNAGVQAHVGLIKNDLIENLAYYTYNTSGTWTGDVVLGSVNDNYYITLSAKEDGQSTECFEQLVYHIYSPPI